MKKFLREVWGVYRPLKFAILGVIGFIALSQALNLASPFLQSKLIDALVSKGSAREIYTLAILSFLLWQFRGTVYRLLRERYELNYIDGAIKDKLQDFTFGKLFGFSIGQHTNENSGIKQSVINRGESALEGMMNLLVYQVLPLVAETVILTGILLYSATTIGLIVLSAIILTCFFIWRLNMSFRKDFKEIERRYIRDSKIEGEIVRNIAMVMAQAQEKKAKKECEESQAYAYNFLKTTWLRFMNWTVLRDQIPLIGRFAVLLVGIQGVSDSTYTLGEFVMYITWSANTLGSLGEMSALHRQLIRSYSSIKRYFEMLSIEPDVKVVENPVRPKKFEGRIEFKNVTFRYKSREAPASDDPLDDEEIKPRQKPNLGPALNNVSFVIEAGKTVAFVGESGAGKSTLVKALIRAQDPAEGQVIVDGNDLRVLDLQHFRESIGIVDQDVTLFDQTLRYNITYGLNGRSETVTDHELRQVAESSRIDRFYDRLERGFDTLIGERGIKLSGGERQRVGIARALVKEPDILIFDEATSNLDSENEAMIRESIEGVSRGRTTIIIAHRFSTIRNVDKVFVFDKGLLVGEGTHEELAQTCEHYKRLVKNQQIA